MLQQNNSTAFVADLNERKPLDDDKSVKSRLKNTFEYYQDDKVKLFERPEPSKPWSAFLKKEGTVTCAKEQKFEESKIPTNGAEKKRYEKTGRVAEYCMWNYDPSKFCSKTKTAKLEKNIDGKIERIYDKENKVFLFDNTSLVVRATRPWKPFSQDTKRDFQKSNTVNNNLNGKTRNSLSYIIGFYSMSTIGNG